MKEIKSATNALAIKTKTNSAVALAIQKKFSKPNDDGNIELPKTPSFVDSIQFEDSVDDFKVNIYNKRHRIIMRIFWNFFNSEIFMP